MFNKKILIIISIIITGLLIRAVGITLTPARLTVDEMSIGYNAYSVSQTLKDEWGQALPIVFKAFGDQKLPVYIYLTTIFVKIFGLNTLSVKLVSILSGTILIWLIYLISKNIFKNDSIAIINSSIIAFSPWTIHLSRQALESNLALVFFATGLLFLLKTYKNKNNINIFLSAIFFGLTFYSYIVYRFIITILLIISTLLVRKNKCLLKKIFLISTLIFILCLPIAKHIFDNQGTARFKQISIFSDSGIVMKIDEERSLCYLKNKKFLPKICKLAYNKPIEWSKQFVKNYIQTLSFDFLFVNGDKLKYLNIPNNGEFFLFLSPFYFLGLFFLIKNLKFKNKLILLILLISPIASSLVGPPQMVRDSLMVIPISIILSLGIYESYIRIINNKIKKIYLISLLSITFLAFFIYLLNYFIIYPTHYDNAAFEISSNTAEYIKNKENKYDLIYFSKMHPDMYIYLAFYNKFNPSWLQTNVKHPPEEASGFTHPYKLGKYEFGEKNLDTFLCNPTENILFISKNINDYPRPKGKYLIENRNFTGVHVQDVMIDISQYRKNLIENKIIQKVCPVDNLKER